MMIGYLDLGAIGRRTLLGDGTWSGPDPDAVDGLNARFSPADPETGDHHRPFGVAALCRADAAWGVEPHLAVEPYPPLPEGDVS